MGVPGFTTYLDSNTHLFLDFKLKNTKIIVDGNNLLHFLYNLYQIPYHYGGDYTIFADTCRHFFSSLKKCLVVPYVVFDGAYDLDGKKFNSSRLRTAKKVTASLNNTKDGCVFVVPLLTHEIFKEILEELSIKHVTCNYEADDQIASLAAEWKCPVLTNDSDFFIFDLPGGVILLDYLNMAIKTDEDGAFYMDVQMYSAEKLKKVMGIHDHSLIHLFATVMGNEYIPGSTFEQFFKKLNYFSHVPGIKLNQIPNDRRKIFGLFKWFALKRNVKAAIRDIMFELNCNTDEENRIRALIDKSIEKYSLTNCYIHVIFNNYDEVFKSEDNFSKVDTGKLMNNHDECAPVCFKMHFNKGALNSKLANIFVSQKVLLQPQIENRTDPSAHVCTSKIRELLYGLLLKNSPEQEVVEFTRGFSRLDKVKTKPRWKFSNGCDLPVLNDVYKLPADERRLIFLDLFLKDQKWFVDYPLAEQLFLATLIYCTTHAKPNLTKFHIWSLLITFFACEIVKNIKNPGINASNSADNIVITISDYLLTSKGKRKYFEISDLHGFAQFQTCFHSLWELNSLLQHPIMTSSLASFYNGTTLMYIYYHLEAELTRIDEFLREVFANDLKTFNYVLELFKKIYKSDGDYVDEKQIKVASGSGTSKSIAATTTTTTSHRVKSNKKGKKKKR